MSATSQAPALAAHFTGRLGGFALDAAFEMAPSGITALTGPSGSGKTTVLRCIAGLTRLAGRLRMDGEVWQDGRAFLPPHRRPVGMVFQDASLLPHLSVKANLLYGRNRTRAPQQIRFEEAVELLGLERLLARSVGALSGGERQRAALGRALLSQPRLLLMDEPLSSLDAEAKAEIMPYLERMHRSLQIPVLYVSHDAAEVRRLADHMLVMENGRIVGAVADLKASTNAQDADRLSAAQQRLAGLDQAQVGRLALAALLAGLKPD